MWYYSPSSPSVPALADSTSECMTLWADALARSFSWNTKSLPAKSWLRVLRTVPWMTRRFGETSTPSMLAHSAESWLASLEDIPASRSALPGSDSEPPTRAISGRQSAESSVSASLIGASSKTWLDTFDSDIGTLFAQTSNALATGSRKASSRRRKSAPHTEGSGSLSWRSPAAQEPGVSADSLTGATGMWRTPDSPSSGGPRNRQESIGQGHQTTIAEQAEHWMTPSANEDAAGTVDGKMQKMLTHQAKEWATPRGSDWNGASMERVNNPEKRFQLREQDLFAEPSHPDLEMPPHGNESSESAPTSRRQLNPRFVEWLQGWTPGHTSLVHWCDE